MKKKLKSEAGMTLVELLAATLIMVLLGLILSTGLDMALRRYRDLTAQSEVELLLSTAVDALADDLRFARNVSKTDDDVPEDECSNFIYKSDSFGPDTKLTLGAENTDYAGQIMAQKYEEEVGGTLKPSGAPMRFLSTGAYGVERADGSRAYMVEKMDIEYKEDNTFEIHLKVLSRADANISAETNVTVRCLNPRVTISQAGGAGS